MLPAKRRGMCTAIHAGHDCGPHRGTLYNLNLV
jgi:hypothetical protein